MNGLWELVIHGPSMDFLLSCRSAERRRVLEFCDQLRSNPYQQGDYQETDLTGRRLQVRIIGNYALTFWADPAVKEVRVVRIEAA